jgi:putative flippase GtrA
MDVHIAEIKRDVYRYITFVFGGGLSLILNLLITYLLTELVHLWHMLSFAIALGVEILFLFIYHSFITFKKRGRFLLFVIVVLGISAANWLFVYVLSVVLNVYYLIAIIVSAAVISIINYLINKKLVFNC